MECDPRRNRLETIRIPTREMRVRALGILRTCGPVTITQNQPDVWRQVPSFVVDRLLAEGVDLECLSR